jgi:hypothetical protein
VFDYLKLIFDTHAPLDSFFNLFADVVEFIQGWVVVDRMSSEWQVAEFANVRLTESI